MPRSSFAVKTSSALRPDSPWKGRAPMMMRFTIVDHLGTISFPGPPHALKALAASCSAGAGDHRALLDSLAHYDADLSAFVLNGLAVFDEHVAAANPDSIRAWLAQSAD